MPNGVIKAKTCHELRGYSGVIMIIIKRDMLVAIIFGGFENITI